MNITGLESLFGSEQSLLDRVARALARRGFTARLAIASTVGAAWAMAHYGQSPSTVSIATGLADLANLPVEALRLSAATVELLTRLGIKRIDQLLKLPRESLAARFDSELLRRLDQASGLAPEAIVPHRPPPEISFRQQLEYPLAQRDRVEAILTSLMQQVTQALASRQQGTMSLECELTCQAGEALCFEIGLFRASALPRHLMELLRMRLERLTLPGPVIAVRLSALRTVRLQSRQGELFADPRDDPHSLACLIDRLSSRLGRQRVLRASLVADSQPEYAYRYEPLAGEKIRRPEKRCNIPLRPMLLEPRPVPLAAISVAPDGPPVRFRFRGRQESVQQSWGPERIQTGWWRGNYIRRDYYRVETDSGNHLWLFRQKGKWFLHGAFD